MYMAHTHFFPVIIRLGKQRESEERETGRKKKVCLFDFFSSCENISK
jgi:hypothetical protein